MQNKAFYSPETQHQWPPSEKGLFKVLRGTLEHNDEFLILCLNAVPTNSVPG